MEHQSTLPFLRETLLFLTLAGVLIPLLQRFRVNQVIGFLVVGLLVGPNGIALWVDRWPWLGYFTFPQLDGVHALAELGILFLMFLIGLELSVDRVWAMRRWVFAGGTVQVLASAFLIGLFAWAFGNGGEVSLIIGLVLALSSTAVVMQLLSQRRELASPMGQASFAILMLQDFAVVPLLILVELLARQSSAELGTMVTLTVLKSVGVVALIFLVGRRLVGPLFGLFARQRQPEVFMALTLLVTLSIAGATAAAGLSMALGAFLAGLLLAETAYRHEVEVTIEPFKGLLMGLFFMSVGLAIDVREIAREPLLVVASVLGLLIIKSAVTTTVLRVGGLSWGRSVEGGMLLAQGGEFAFIIFGYAASAGLLKAEVSSFMFLVVSLSLMATPVVALLGRRLGEKLDAGSRLRPLQVEPSMPDNLGGHVVIAGFGRVGQLLAEVFEKNNVTYVAIEHDAHVAARMRSQGRPVFYGNAARPDFLRKLHLSSAAALVVTMDQPAAAMHTVLTARAEYPGLPIYARSRDEPHAAQLRDAGATAVVPETLEAGLQLSSFTLQALGLSEALVGDILEAERERRILSDRSAHAD